jgi:hypothetical protein
MQPEARPAGSCHRGAVYETTWYFRNDVIKKRPYLIEMYAAVIETPLRHDGQDDGRHRFRARAPELGDRILRVVTLEDGRTIHNAFPDRGFRL